MLSQVRLWGPSWSMGRDAVYYFGREPSNDYFIKIQFLLSKWFQTRRFLWEFPIGSHVKLSSAVVAILVGGLKCQTQYWKGTTQGSFQQSLVEIGSVVSEENFFLKFHPPFFYFQLGGHLGWKSGSPDTIFKGATNGPFHQSLVAIGLVVSEEKIKM